MKLGRNIDKIVMSKNDDRLHLTKTETTSSLATSQPNVPGREGAGATPVAFRVLARIWPSHTADGFFRFPEVTDAELDLLTDEFRTLSNGSPSERQAAKEATLLPLSATNSTRPTNETVSSPGEISETNTRP